MKRYLIMRTDMTYIDEYYNTTSDIEEAKRYKTIKEAKSDLATFDNWNSYLIVSVEIEEETYERFNNIKIISDRIDGGYSTDDNE